MSKHLHGSPPPGVAAVPGWAVKAFWSDFRDRLRPDAEVSVVPEPLEATGLRTAMGEPVAGPAVAAGRYYVFFIDQMPAANWAHECAYAFLSESGGRAWAEAQWPPDESIKLLRIDAASGWPRGHLRGAAAAIPEGSAVDGE